MATVVVTAQAREQIAGLPITIIARMEALMQRLRNWPDVSGAKRLKGALAGSYRLRTGDYRLQFRVKTIQHTNTVRKLVRGKWTVEEVTTKEVRVIVDRAGHRDGFYDD